MLSRSSSHVCRSSFFGSRRCDGHQHRNRLTTLTPCKQVQHEADHQHGLARSRLSQHHQPASGHPLQHIRQLVVESGQAIWAISPGTGRRRRRLAGPVLSQIYQVFPANSQGRVGSPPRDRQLAVVIELTYRTTSSLHCVSMLSASSSAASDSALLFALGWLTLQECLQECLPREVQSSRSPTTYQ